ncbi:MAG: hypothetical protein KJS92_10370, partial [Bacteroidetes bacterium]|nr:hypothetical protein [Bacteroidota bacterium]
MLPASHEIEVFFKGYRYVISLLHFQTVNVIQALTTYRYRYTAPTELDYQLPKTAAHHRNTTNGQRIS